jgi:hypothetical protein
MVRVAGGCGYDACSKLGFIHLNKKNQNGLKQMLGYYPKGRFIKFLLILWVIGQFL